MIQKVEPEKLIEALTKKLKNMMKQPEWSLAVKTACFKERPPEQPDWWYKRVASLLRKLYLKGPIGVSRLRKFYGGRAKRKKTPGKFKKGSGKIIREMLQQLEALGLVKKERKGRALTDKGKKLLDEIALSLHGRA